MNPRWRRMLSLALGVAVSLGLVATPALALSDNGTAAFNTFMNDYSNFFYDLSGNYVLTFVNDYPCSLQGTNSCTNANTNWNYWWEAHALMAILDQAQRDNAQGQVSTSTLLQDAEEMVQGTADLNSNIYNAGGMCSDNNALDRCWNDDMAWMGLAVLRVWDMTNQSTYLNDAESLFNQIYGSYGGCSSAGVPWEVGSNGNPCQKNTAANATAAMLGAELYLRTGTLSYLNDAENLMAFEEKYLVHSNGEVADTVWFNSDGTVQKVTDTSGGWTYNQGAVIGAGVYLYLAEFRANRGRNYTQYLTDAQHVMSYVLSEWPNVLPKGGANGGCGFGAGGGQGDCGLFNGILIRYAQKLLDLDGQYTTLYDWLQNNATMAYDCADYQGLYGPDWTCNTGNAASYEPLDLSTDTSGVFVENIIHFVPEGQSVYQAENGIHTMGVYRNATNYTGFGFLGGWNQVGQYSEINPYEHSAGTYKLTIRYSAATGTATRDLYVNGVYEGSLSFAGTSSWSDWQTLSVNIPLNAGVNTIEVDNPGTVYLNIDKYMLSCVSGCTTY